MTTVTVPALPRWITANASTNRHWRHRHGLVKAAGQAGFSGRIKSAPGGAGNTLRGLTRSSGTSREGLA